ncbi:hypothetical protein B0H11DRAFT_2371425 [Mycena galericulata]|nr:hypothetical protein B0H11DRAFT_2371425 [Mycena galericulata]
MHAGDPLLAPHPFRANENVTQHARAGLAEIEEEKKHELVPSSIFVKMVTKSLTSGPTSSPILPADAALPQLDGQRNTALSAMEAENVAAARNNPRTIDSGAPAAARFACTLVPCDDPALPVDIANGYTVRAPVLEVVASRFGRAWGAKMLAKWHCEQPRPDANVLEERPSPARGASSKFAPAPFPDSEAFALDGAGTDRFGLPPRARSTRGERRATPCTGAARDRYSSLESSGRRGRVETGLNLKDSEIRPLLGFFGDSPRIFTRFTYGWGKVMGKPLPKDAAAHACQGADSARPRFIPLINVQDASTQQFHAGLP